MIRTKGKVCKTPRSDGLFCTETEETCEDYKVDAPKLEGNGPENQSARMDFAACISGCGGDWGDCGEDTIKDLGPCNPGGDWVLDTPPDN